MPTGRTVKVVCPACSKVLDRNARVCPGCGANPSVTLVVKPGERTQGYVADPSTFPPGARFARRYTLIEQVRVGGMGVVYKAIDTTLDGTVALKLIRPSLVAIGSLRERFRREARLARRVTHENICRVHDIGESAGVLYLSMEWIDGETLRQLLRQARTLQPARALEIADKVAAALEAAHAANVIHRDLKPANVMIDGQGRVRVLDFGLALEPADARGDGTTLAGTPRYMAPEQREGRPVDPRTDLYALGAILLEMLVGSSGRPPSPGELGPEIAALLRRLLAESPEDRPPTAAAVREELQRLIGEFTPVPTRAPPLARRSPLLYVAASTAVLALAVLGLYWIWPSPSLPAPVRAAYAAGVEQLRQEDHEEDVREAIRQFTVALDRAPDSPVIMAGLAEAYFRLYEHSERDSAREQAERWLSGAEGLDDSFPELHNAKSLGQRIQGRYEDARAEAERAIDQRPEFAAAWINLAAAHRELGQHDRGLRALKQVEEWEPRSLHVQLELARFYLHFEEWAQAEQHFERASALRPDSITALNGFAELLLREGRFDEATEKLRRSLEIRETAEACFEMGKLLYSTRRYDEAAEQFSRATDLEPAVSVYWCKLGDALLAGERERTAEDAYERACELARQAELGDPASTRKRARAALHCAQAGDARALEDLVAEAELEPGTADCMLSYAAAFARFDRPDAALVWLERAYQSGVTDREVAARPEFAALEGDERFRRLLERRTVPRGGS